MSDSPKPKTDWEAIEREYVAGELGVERIAIAMILYAPGLCEEMHWPKLRTAQRQLKLGGAIADIVLEHEDNSITLIEVKAGGRGLRDYCTGIGQLAYQSIMAVSVFQTLAVRRVLAMPGPIPPDVGLACMAADVDILPLPTRDQWIGFMREAAQEREHVA